MLNSLVSFNYNIFVVESNFYTQNSLILLNYFRFYLYWIYEYFHSQRNFRNYFLFFSFTAFYSFQFIEFCYLFWILVLCHWISSFIWGIGKFWTRRLYLCVRIALDRAAEWPLVYSPNPSILSRTLLYSPLRTLDRSIVSFVFLLFHFIF